MAGIVGIDSVDYEHLKGTYTPDQLRAVARQFELDEITLLLRDTPVTSLGAHGLVDAEAEAEKCGITLDTLLVGLGTYGRYLGTLMQAEAKNLRRLIDNCNSFVPFDLLMDKVNQYGDHFHSLEELVCRMVELLDSDMQD